jgi:glycosyltransferase involved in cell wall biosynthesis
MSDLDVAVNLLWLAPGRVGGSEQYLVRQLAGLPAGGGVRPRLMVQRPFVAAHSDLAGRFTTEVWPLDRDWRGARIIAEHTWLVARSRRADVVHHGGGTVPLAAPRPILLTVHDLQYLAHPDYFSQARLTYLRWMMPRSVRRAAVVAVPSAYVRTTVVDAFGADPDRVVVVPHGVPIAAPVDASFVESLRGTYALGTRPYLLYPAITHPHKGHAVLIEMMNALDGDLALVLVGGRGAAEDDVMAAVRDHGLADRVVRTGRIGDAERDALIAGAAALVFPSEYEGFGAPLVEAMTLDTPIVASAQPAVREVVGDAGILVGDGDGDSADGEAWASAVCDAIGHRDRLVAAGRSRREAFTLEASGAALAAAYRQAAAG